MDEIRVFEGFSGYGSQSCSLKDMNVNHKVVATSEIDADAIIAYAPIRFSKDELTKEIDKTDDEIKEWLMDKNIGYDFSKNKSSIPRMKKAKLHMLYNSCILSNNLGDISIINTNDIPDHDYFTYSFPCQSVSIAGKQEGLEKGSGTKSSLLWECQKVIHTKKQKYLLMENVKNLVSKKFKPFFDEWCEWLEGEGYTNYWKVLNAKDYRIPQNRERVFMVSILGDHDIYEFPFPTREVVKLKDILEDEVAEKYYINKRFTLIDKKDTDSVCSRIANVDLNGHDYIKRVYDTEKCCPTLPTGTGGNHEPKILQVGKLNSSQDGLVIDSNGISPTHTAGHGNRQKILENKIIHIANTNDSYESNVRVYSGQ